jgi:predicted RNA binding protein YcfA (HicA-like mRNA interferase family)
MIPRDAHKIHITLADTRRDVHKVRMKTRDVISALEADGWRHVATKGSHRQFKHPTKPGRVTVPFHGGNADIGTATLTSIERQSGLKLRRRD